MAKKKSWREKLADDKNLPQVSRIPAKLQKSWGKGTFVIARPRDVDAIMRRVPAGKVITIKEICVRLAKKYRPMSLARSPRGFLPGSRLMRRRKMRSKV